MVERLFEGVALRKARLEKERQDKLDKMSASSSNTLPVPTAYQQGEPRTAWIAPVPLEQSTIPKKSKNGWGITKTIQVTTWRYDWSNWETPNEKAREIWRGLDDILSGKREWPERGEKILYGRQNSTVCPQCGQKGANKKLLQTRSADEAPTEILTCIHCGHTWRAKD